MHLVNIGAMNEQMRYLLLMRVVLLLRCSMTVNSMIGFGFCAGNLGGGFRNAGICFRLDVVRQWGQFHDWIYKF